MSKDYDFETATEGERWAYDQGYERGHQEALSPQDMDDIELLLEAAIAGLTRLIEQEKALKQSGAAYTGREIPPVEGLHDSGDDL